MAAHWQDHSSLLALHFRRGGQGRCSGPQSSRHYQGGETQGQGWIHSILRCHGTPAIVNNISLFCQAASSQWCLARVQEKGKLILRNETDTYKSTQANETRYRSTQQTLEHCSLRPATMTICCRCKMLKRRRMRRDTGEKKKEWYRNSALKVNYTIIPDYIHTFFLSASNDSWYAMSCSCLIISRAIRSLCKQTPPSHLYSCSDGG